MSETWYEEHACPSDECKGQIRRFKFQSLTAGSGKVIARVQRCTWCGYSPGDLQRSQPGTTVAEEAVAAEEIEAPESAADQAQELEEFGYVITWYRAEDGMLLVLVHDAAGNLLDGGGGDNPVDVLVGVAGRLLPPPAA